VPAGTDGGAAVEDTGMVVGVGLSVVVGSSTREVGLIIEVVGCEVGAVEVVGCEVGAVDVEVVDVEVVDVEVVDVAVFDVAVFDVAVTVAGVSDVVVTVAGGKTVLGLAIPMDVVVASVAGKTVVVTHVCELSCGTADSPRCPFAPLSSIANGTDPATDLR
jgi:hypothetical protein